MGICYTNKIVASTVLTCHILCTVHFSKEQESHFLAQFKMGFLLFLLNVVQNIAVEKGKLREVKDSLSSQVSCNKKLCCYKPPQVHNSVKRIQQHSARCVLVSLLSLVTLNVSAELSFFSTLCSTEYNHIPHMFTSM